MARKRSEIVDPGDNTGTVADSPAGLLDPDEGTIPEAPADTLPAGNGVAAVKQPTALDDYKAGRQFNWSYLPSSLDFDDPRSRAIAFNCTGQQTLEIDGNGFMEMEVAHYLIHPAKAIDEDTGEINYYWRTVLIAPDGNTFATASEVVPERLRDLLAMMNGVAFDKGTRIQIVQRKGRRSKRLYHDIRLVV